MLKYPCWTYFHGKIMIDRWTLGFFMFFPVIWGTNPTNPTNPPFFSAQSRCNSAPSGILPAAPRSLRSDGYKPHAWARREEYHHRPQPKGCRWMERDSSLQPIESRPLVAWWLGGFDHSLWKAARGNWGVNWWFQWWMFRMGDGLMPCLLEDTCCNSPQTVGFTPLKWPSFISRQQDWSPDSRR